jgi:NADH-quinone oxidoreductase subunit J
MNVAFYILAGIAVGGALAAVRLRNLVYAVLALMVFFTALAGIFILLVAEFIAAAQILVYVGAVGILLLFAVMLTRHVTGVPGKRTDSRGWWIGLLCAAGLLFALVLPAIRNTELLHTEDAITPSVAQLGQALMSPYVITLHIMGLLLTAALVGAVTIALGATKNEKTKS